MNLPNKLTLLRILLVPFILLCFCLPPGWGMWVAVVLFVVAAVTDTVDGRYARAHNMVTDFGKFMDPIADKLLVNSVLIMLTARGEEIDRILGLEMGADDYIVKPFSPREVISRIKAVLRRTNQGAAAPQEERLTTLRYGSLEIQPERYSVRLNGQAISCTPREVELLDLLASHPGRVFDREQILSRIWGYDFFGDTRTVDTHIKRLRQKLSCPEMGKVWDIMTVYGVGYKFEAEA